MEIDGWTMMIYDKFSGDHSYNNKNTMNITMQELFTSNSEQLENKDAVKEFNKFGGLFTIDNNLDEKMYKVIMFTTYRANEKYTVIGVNNKLIKKYVAEAKPIPNEEFFKTLCKYHICYTRATSTGGKISISGGNIIKSTEDIISCVTSKTGDIVDEIIESPEFLTLKLHDYQKRSIKWMLQCEKNEKSISFNMNDEILLGDSYYDVQKQKIIKSDDRRKITFRGGALIDEVGLGKTIQISTMSVLNQATNTSYTRKNSKRLYSRATLVMCPNQLCGQWTRELQDKFKKDYGLTVIPLLTKIQYDKYTYQDLLDADFVILSYTFLDNKNFLTPWMEKISSSKSYHKAKQSEFKTEDVLAELDKQGDMVVKDPLVITRTKPQILLIYWHRIVMDEFHEIYTVPKYNYMINLLPLFQSRFKWCVTGTPFNKSASCLYNMLDFVSGFTNIHGDRILANDNIKNYITNSFFRRNTKQSVTSEYKLPPTHEKIIWLKFTPTERMMYNAYLANPNNSKFSIFLRQLCCHPKLADEIKDSLANCKTLADIEKMMIKHNEKEMKNAELKLNLGKKRLARAEIKLKKFEHKRQKRMLKKMGYAVTVEKLIYDKSLFIKDKGVDLDGELILDGIDDNDASSSESEDSDGDDDDSKERIIVNDANQKKIMDILKKTWNDNRVTLDTYYDNIIKIKDVIKELNKTYEGKKTTFDFFNNVLERIKKTAEKKNTKKDADDSDDSDNDNDDETCGICLGEITGEDIGVTKCGHMFCYQCIKVIIAQKHECPYCRKSVKENELYMISYEIKKNIADITKELKDKTALINEVGTKLANLIYFLKKENKHTIIFSQWDDLLHKVGDVLSTHGIKNTFCRGHVYQRDKAIRTFNTEEDVKVIMLSSESAASGTNLTKASQVILLDPVYGTYEYRRNTEGQAIGRAHRMGQTKEVDIVRFIIKDTIEEELFNSNREDDKMYKINTPIFESNADSLTLSDEKVKEISESVADSKNKKKHVIRKKIVKKIAEKIDDEHSDSDY